jgi:hypothetical protein
MIHQQSGIVSHLKLCRDRTCEVRPIHILLETNDIASPKSDKEILEHSENAREIVRPSFFTSGPVFVDDGLLVVVVGCWLLLLQHLASFGSFFGACRNTKRRHSSYYYYGSISSLRTKAPTPIVTRW